jgi:transcriptional regulator with XRE-family HTH domain
VNPPTWEGRPAQPAEPASNDQPLPTRLRRVRERAGLTRPEVAKAVGVEPATIIDYELNRRHPGVDRLGVPALTLGCSVSDFYEAVSG